jgi:hypothetical protein
MLTRTPAVSPLAGRGSTVTPLYNRVPSPSPGLTRGLRGEGQGEVSGRRRSRLALAGMAVVALTAAMPAWAAEAQDCVRAETVLWGDGKHDDTAALNAWLHGDNVIWASNGAPVGAAIAGRSFRLSAAIYVASGTGRELSDFRLLWPERGETVAGGTIEAGADPNQPPIVSDVKIAGGDAGEGKAFSVPDSSPPHRDPSLSCATS